MSVEDLTDALVDDTEDEGVSLRRRKETLDTDNEEFRECPGAAATSLSSSCPDTTSCSEGSVSNSPNPRTGKTKGKKGKKKKR